MRRLTSCLMFAMIASTACARRGQLAPAVAPSTSVWTLDYMMTKPGQRDRYLRYLDANWARSRQTLLNQGRIRSFNVLVRTPTDTAPWDVVLVTEYSDSTSQANAEAMFLPIREAQGETLIDGLSGRGPDNVLKKTVFTHVLTPSLRRP
jgi:hypothetical protein